MMTISKILEEEINVHNELPEDINANDTACMKYAPINTADVESIYKNILIRPINLYPVIIMS